MREVIMSNDVSALQTRRQLLPQRVLTWLPLTLFFPVGVMYSGVLLFYICLLTTGDLAQKLQRVRQHPMLFPVLGLSFVTIVVAMHQDTSAHEFWPAFWHYQIYLFLLPMLAVGADVRNDANAYPWQLRAQHFFFVGAIFAATLFYLNALHLLPNNVLFRSYVIYQGNKSILLGILLAIAAGWMLHARSQEKTHSTHSLFAFIYVVIALFFLAKTRSASLIFIALCLVVALRNFRWHWRYIAPLLILSVFLSGAFGYVATLPAPPTCSTNLMKGASALTVAATRGICTVQQLRDFRQGKKINEDGMRLEIYKNTVEMIVEKPLTGHGIGTWLPQYQAKTRGLISETMTTPHNDYLLYLDELGLLGLLALLWIYISQLWIARQMRGTPLQDRAMLLAMLGVTMLVGSMFNALLRDSLFGMALMILLAIPLAGVEKGSKRKHERRLRD